MKIKIDYPVQKEFSTSKVFSNNDERTDWLVSELQKQKIHSPCHDYTDYIVEYVKKNKDGSEYWIIGS